MNLRDWLVHWHMTSLKIKAPFLDMEWKPGKMDRQAAWDLYIELLTRITTQPLASDHGDEKTALDSIHALFPLTREIVKANGPECIAFTKIAIVILNQKIRPFTAKWHRKSLQGAFTQVQECDDFRRELLELQAVLLVYAQMLADMAGVEDLTDLEG